MTMTTSPSKDPLIASLREHPRAPVFNTDATDMLSPAFLQRVRAFHDDLVSVRDDAGAKESMVARRVLEVLLLARRAVLKHVNDESLRDLDVTASDALVARVLGQLPTSQREDLARWPWRVIPIDAPLDELFVYRTAGTTAEPMNVPSHPVATGCYSPLLAEAMHRWDIHPAFSPGVVGIALIGFQATSVTVATRLQALNNAGFVKLNISASEWHDPLDPYRYIASIAPLVLTGDPFSFAELAHAGDRLVATGEMGGHYTPACLITTAVSLKAAVRNQLQRKFGAPVIDLYSLTETGPIASGCKFGHGYHVLPHDIHVEVLDEHGNCVPDGELGEITVTGGRNPFFPLIRYRTGDWGRIDRSGRCECGVNAPCLHDLEGRVPVQYHTVSGRWINDRDVSAVMGGFPVTRFTFHQDPAGNFSLVARLAPFDTTTTADRLRQALEPVLGLGASIDVNIDPSLGDRARGKVIPFTTEYALFYD